MSLRINISKIAVVVVYLFVGCEETISNLDQKVMGDLNKELIQNFEAILSKEGENRSKIKGDSVIRVFEEKTNDYYLEFLRGMEVYFYKQDGKTVESNVHSNYCKLYENESKNVILKNKVIVKSDKKEILKTEELFWNKQGKYFYTDKYFTFTSPSQILRGYGMKANEDLSEIQTFKTTGNILVSENSPSDPQKQQKQKTKKEDEDITEQFDF